MDEFNIFCFVLVTIYGSVASTKYNYKSLI